MNQDPQINIQARLERHAKLKEENVQIEKPTPSRQDKKADFRERMEARVSRLFRDPNQNPMVFKLFKRVLAITFVFLLVVPFLPDYHAHGFYLGELQGHGDFIPGELAEEAEEFTIANVMTEDGFLLKPAINSAEGDRSGFSEIFVYTVEPGDNLSTIAQRFSIKKETLMAENNLWNPNRLRVGSKLKILPVDGLSHKVSKGETVEKIAKKYKVEPETIIAQNQLVADEELASARVLIVPGAKRTAPVYTARATAPASAANYGGPKAVGRLIWPAGPGSKLTQGYHRRHTALDIGNRAKGPIYASASGKVIKARGGWNGGYGNYIIIDHGGGMQTLYGHNEKLYVTEGQYVEQGQTIAWMGNTGRVYGPTGIHVHFEVRINGVKYNPMNFF